jgi:hypothetical protein
MWWRRFSRVRTASWRAHHEARKHGAAAPLGARVAACFARPSGLCVAQRSEAGAEGLVPAKRPRHGTLPAFGDRLIGPSE